VKGIMQRGDHRIFEFSDFRVEVAEHSLIRNGNAIPLRPKLFDLLVYLLEHSGVVLEKDEITKAVWGSLSQGSAEHPTANLTVNISNLRQALGDDSEKPMFIETVPHRGYRFRALVQLAEAPQAQNGHPVFSSVVVGNGSSHSHEPVIGSALVGRFTSKISVTDESESQARQKPKSVFWKSSQSAVIAASIVLVAIAAWLVWAVAKPRSNSLPEVANSSNSSNSSNSPGNLMGKELRSGNTVFVPQIVSIEPDAPSAWIGDKPIKIRGSGFRSGLSVMMLFPGGGSATLQGVAVLDVTANEFTLLADFNNNPGEYRIRINSAEGVNSNWFDFDVLPASLLPEINEVKQAKADNGKLRLAISGRNFLQSVHAVLTYPDGQKEYLTGHRVTGELFQVVFDPRGMAGPFRLQAQNAGKGSNIVSFSIANP
ncbi:MAG: winged helix-turn-helix domain-containing protein, partial [Blastocatellia bacterium]